MSDVWREEWSVKIGRKCMRVWANEISDGSLIANCEVLMWSVVYVTDINCRQIDRSIEQGSIEEALERK